MTTATRREGRHHPAATICVRRQQVHRKSQHTAEPLIRENLSKEGIHRGPLTIQSDRGSAIRSQAVAQAGHRWGDQVLSRPHVSDARPLSESSSGAVEALACAFRRFLASAAALLDSGIDKANVTASASQPFQLESGDHFGEQLNHQGQRHENVQLLHPAELAAGLRCIQFWPACARRR